ncbi:MAG: hypothetical protein IKC32_05165 [Clostridia bacterium]|nr:hypothetical protein [Clostridia bacterium]
MKRIVSIILVLALALASLASCVTEPKALSAPTNVSLSDTGLITWDAVEGAESYTVTINDKSYETETNSYQVTSLKVDFTYSVVANADGYLSSPPSEEGTYRVPYVPPVDTTPDIAVAISGKSEVRYGTPITLSATVSGTEDQTVMWTVVSGGELVELDAISGKLSAKSLNEGGIVEVRATSLADESCYGSKVITVLTPPELTQDMIDLLATQTKLGFEGFINISLYTIGVMEKFYMSSSTTVKTSLDGEHWYAEYDNLDLGIVSQLYFKNDNGIASQVGVSFENNEEYAPMLDENGSKVTWIDSGLYNNFVGLTVSDFEFNEEKWCYEYVGSDEDLPQRMVAAANPYDFKAVSLSLIIEDGEIMGIRALSASDYGIASGYRAVQELTVAVNFGETVEVPTISKYPTDPDGNHDPLIEAIANMQSQTNYTLDFVETTASYLSNGYVVSGFTETVTDDLCYFDPFNVKYSSDGQEIRTYTEAPYGYLKVSDTLYNAFYSNGEGSFNATRAWSGSFDATKPTFKFAAEIFTSYYEEKDEDTDEVKSITYYVDAPMSAVASTFYYGVGNDIQLYGIFATTGYLSSTETFTPFVVVEEVDGIGYIITEACFYFYIGSIYGVVEIKYSDFGTAKVDDEEAEKLEAPAFEHREIPTKWNELTIIMSNDESSIEEDKEMRADLALVEFFGDPDMAQKLPFFGAVLGDTYGFGLTTFHLPSGSDSAKPAIVFYYDVPLDMDYSIDDSLAKVNEFLVEEGFTRNARGEFVKGNLHISPLDVSLDFTIYVWIE